MSNEAALRTDAFGLARSQVEKVSIDPPWNAQAYRRRFRVQSFPNILLLLPEASCPVFKCGDDKLGRKWKRSKWKQF